MEPGGGLDAFDGVDVRIINGRSPELVITTPHDKRIDLTVYAQRDALRELLRTEGFVDAPAGAPRNVAKDCYQWRARGECLSNAVYMRDNCARACGGLRDENARCAEWAAAGECESNPRFMLGTCPVACGSRRSKAEL